MFVLRGEEEKYIKKKVVVVYFNAIFFGTNEHCRPTSFSFLGQMGKKGHGRIC